MDRHPILKMRLQQERHVVHARQRARDIAALLGFDRQEQVRLATATSEVARNAFRYAVDGAVEFAVSLEQPQRLWITVTDAGPGIPHLETVLSGNYQSKTGMGKGLTGTRRLMSQFRIESGSSGTTVILGKELPAGAAVASVASISQAIATLSGSNIDPFAEVERQNQELVRTLSELRDKQELLAQVNRELEDTNRGVVALYAELEQNASDLRRVSNQKTSFLSNLSHEFRTPLNAILALCGILQSRSDGDLTPEQEKQVGYIKRSAADLSELVNDLLDVAKVEAGKLDVKPTQFSVADLFGALRGMLRTLLTGSRVELLFSDAEDLPQLFTDEQKLSQILRNLISNALKFTESGYVSVSAEAADGWITFRVVDTGIGIALQDQERIFEEFVQIPGTVQSRSRGTGLGLPLSRRLAQLLGGTLTVQSADSAGSTFTVTMPVLFREMEVESVLPAVRQGGGPRVLIVEDNTESRFIHEEALRTSPYTLLFARNIAEAKSVLEADRPDALVLDRMLDGIDALDFLQNLRQTGYSGKVVVISVTDEAWVAEHAGADAFLAKPIASGVLAAKLAELLGCSAQKTLLLVDDDEINRYVLREALAPFALKLSEARSGREALQVVLAGGVDAVFLDMAMPGLTGLETLRELRAAPATTHLPVIIHTSKALTSDELTMIQHLQGQLFPKHALTLPDAADQLRVTLETAGIV